MSDRGTFTFLGRVYLADQYVVSSHGQRARVILRTGRRCGDYIRSGCHIEMENNIPYLRQGDRVTDDNIIRNPLTRRMITIGGRVYRNLIKAGWFHAGVGGGLVQPDGYITLALVGNHREMEAQLATFHTTLPYVYLCRISDNAMVRIRNYPPQLKDVLGARGDLEDEYDRPEDGYERLANGENLFEGYVLVTPTNTFVNAQFLAAADFNGLCVRDSLEQLCPFTDWSDVPESCGPNEMGDVSRRHRCIIRVYTAICLEEPMYEWGRAGNARANRPVFNLFYAFNHCIPVHHTPIEFPSPADSDIPIVWHDTEAGILASMTTLSESQPTMPLVVSTKEGPEFLGFSTLTHHHKIKFVGYEQVPLCWSDRGVARHLFMESNGGKPNIQRRLIPYLKSIVRPGITFMREVSSPTTVHYYDMRRAYASYAECPYYTGFPDPKGILNIVRYDPALLDPSSNLEGVVWVETSLRYPSTCFEDRHMWATFPQVRLALDRKETFEARMMIITTRATGDPYAHVKQTLGDSSKKVFNKLVGRQHMSRVVPTAVARSVDELEHLQDEGFVPLKTMEHNDRKSWICTNLRRAEEKIPEYALVAAYVHQYQKITLHHDLISKVPWSDVVRIWIDGVCLRKPPPHPLPPRWHQEEISRTYIHEVACSSLHKMSLDIDVPQLHPYDPIYHEKRILIHGPPGSGKTYLINEYWLADGREATLTASTNIAALNMHIDAMTIHKFLALHKSDPSLVKQLMQGKDRLIIDEYTMISQKMIEEVLELGYPVALSGDPKQMCHRECPSTEWLEEQRFVTIELPDIKRTRDPETLEIYESCRNLNQKAITKLLQHKHTDAVTYPKSFQRSHYIASTNEVVNTTNILYTNTFEGPTVEWGHNTTTDKRLIRARVAVGMLIIGIKNEKDFKNQEIGHITAILPNKVRIRSTLTQREVEVSLRNLNPGFAITYHRCQGQTFDFPIYVNTNRLFEPNMLYTAITRVTHHRHLQLVK